MRIVALATILSAPIGEKALAEREVNKNKTVAVATEQEDKEEEEKERKSYEKFIEFQEQYFKQHSDIAEQKNFLEKYDNVYIIDIPDVDTFEKQKELQKKHIIDDGTFISSYESEYSVEELKDFNKALEKVRNFAPKQFSELKIVIKKISQDFFFNVCMGKYMR